MPLLTHVFVAQHPSNQVGNYVANTTCCCRKPLGLVDMPRRYKIASLTKKRSQIHTTSKHRSRRICQFAMNDVVEVRFFSLHCYLRLLRCFKELEMRTVAYSHTGFKQVFLWVFLEVINELLHTVSSALKNNTLIS
jgi:hypothetical protein